MSGRCSARAALPAALLVAALAGCGGLPVDGPVVRGDEMGLPAAPSIRQHFAAPDPGASPAEIVRGFVAAGASPGENYRAAREYLTSDFSDDWLPRSRSVVIVPSIHPLRVESLASQADRRTVLLSGSATAVVASNGRYTEVAAATRSAEVGLVQENGEWRIDRLPVDFGLWLEEFDFDAAFGAFSVAYVAATDRVVIPDRHWFPITNAIPTTLARAQLEPVPPYLAGAAVTGFPLLTRLRVDAVAVTDGVANLDLTSQALDGTADQRRAAFAQTWVTMNQAPGVRAVSLAVGSQRLTTGGVADRVGGLDEVGYTLAGAAGADEVVLRNGSSLRTVAAADVRSSRVQPEGAFLPALDAAWSALAVAPDLEELAATSGDRAGLIRWRRDPAAPGGGRSAIQPAFGRELTRPSYDAAGGLWVAGVTPNGETAAWVFDVGSDLRQGTPRRVQAAWLAGHRVIGLRVSPEGQRVAALIRSPRGPVRLAVAGIQRDSTGRAVSLADPLFIGGSLSTAHGVTWASGHSVAVVGRARGQDEDHALLVGVDGRLHDGYGVLPPDAAGGTPVSSGPTRGLLVTAPSGRVYQAVAGGWQQVVQATDLVVPGR